VVKNALAGKLEPNKIVDTAIKSNRPELVKQILKPMSAEGRATFRNTYLDKIYKEASKSGEFDPIKWGKEINKLKATSKGLFTAAQQKELTGLKKLIEHSSDNIKAGQRSVAPLDYLIGTGGMMSGVFINPAKTAAVAGGIKTVSTLLTNPKVGKFLIKMAEAKSPSEVNGFVNKFVKNIARATASSAGKPDERKPEIDYRIK
jgi:hypothetical protein